MTLYRKKRRISSSMDQSEPIASDYAGEIDCLRRLRRLDRDRLADSAGNALSTSQLPVDRQFSALRCVCSEKVSESEVLKKTSVEPERLSSYPNPVPTDWLLGYYVPNTTDEKPLFVDKRVRCCDTGSSKVVNTARDDIRQHCACTRRRAEAVRMTLRRPENHRARCRCVIDACDRSLRSVPLLEKALCGRSIHEQSSLELSRTTERQCVAKLALKRTDEPISSGESREM